MTPDGLVSLNMPGPGKIEPFLTINNLLSLNLIFDRLLPNLIIILLEPDFN